MKKILLSTTIIAALALLMTACNRTGNAKDVSNADTTGLAAFQAWNQQQAATVPAKAATQHSVSNTSSSNASGTMTSSSTHEAQTKKGWSKAAKYSVIGGGAGAVLGAVINKKNRVAGGVIGGVIGGGVGYGIGRSQDKKDGRY